MHVVCKSLGNCVVAMKLHKISVFCFWPHWWIKILVIHNPNNNYPHFAAHFPWWDSSEFITFTASCELKSIRANCPTRCWRSSKTLIKKFIERDMKFDQGVWFSSRKACQRPPRNWVDGERAKMEKEKDWCREMERIKFKVVEWLPLIMLFTCWW